MNLKRHKANVNFTPTPFIFISIYFGRVVDEADERAGRREPAPEKMYAEEYLISEVRNEALEGKW